MIPLLLNAIFEVSKGSKRFSHEKALLSLCEILYGSTNRKKKEACGIREKERRGGKKGQFFIREVGDVELQFFNLHL